MIPTFTAGGAEVFDLRIFSCLPREEYRITLLACEHPDGPWYDEFKSKVDEVFSLQRMGDSWDARVNFLRYLMISKSIDVVFNRNTFYGYDLAARWREASMEVRFVDLLHLHAYGEDWVRESAKHHDKLDLRYVISEHLRDYASTTYGLTKERFRVLRYGLEREEIPSESRCASLRQTIRAQHSIPPSAPVVGFIGRLTDQKDPLRWLSVARRVADFVPDALFLIVGEGELMEDTVAMASASGLLRRVVFAGYQRGAAQFCAAMDVLLMTSKYEGVPLVILEALAHGTAVVSSDVGAVAECVAPGIARLLSLGASHDEYAEAVVHMLGLHAFDSKLRACAHGLLASRFGKDRMASQLRTDLGELASGLNRERRRIDYQLNVMARPILG